MKCGMPDDTGGHQRLDRPFQRSQNSQTDLLDASIVQSAVAIGDLIFLEILQGTRNDKQYCQTKQSLLVLEQYERFGKDMAAKCADNYRALRKKGITITKTADVIIATFCIEKKLLLLFLDRDFISFAEHLGLEPALRET